MVELAAAGHAAAAAGLPAAAVAGPQVPVQFRAGPVAVGRARRAQPGVSGEVVGAAGRVPAAGAGAAGAGPAQFGQVGEREQRAGEGVGQRDPGPLEQPAAAGRVQQVGQLLALGVGTGAEDGQGGAGAGEPAGPGLEVVLVVGVGRRRGPDQPTGVTERLAGPAHRQARVVDGPIGRRPPALIGLCDCRRIGCGRSGSSRASSPDRMRRSDLLRRAFPLRVLAQPPSDAPQLARCARDA